MEAEGQTLPNQPSMRASRTRNPVAMRATVMTWKPSVHPRQPSTTMIAAPAQSP
jgi:hypothetical protein